MQTRAATNSPTPPPGLCRSKLLYASLTVFISAGILEKKCLEALPCQMAPPWGLYLAEVHYDDLATLERQDGAEDGSSDVDGEDESE
jgi:hypothetical protein